MAEILDFFNPDVRIKRAKERMYIFLNELLTDVDFEEIDLIYEETMCELEGFEFEPDDEALNDNEGE